MIRRPALRYYGGKWRIAPWIIDHFPEHRIYVEPFGGGASVLMRKPIVHAEIYNDLDSNVVNFFEVLRHPDMAAELERRCRLTPFAREEYDKAVPSLQTIQGDPIERARLTVFWAVSSFGGSGLGRDSTGFRNNTSRSHTTPAHDWMHWPDYIAQYRDRMRAVVIENRPALDVIETFDGPTTLIYCDPPYDHETRTMKGVSHSYSHEMDEGDHRELSAVLHDVAGMVVISGYRGELYGELYDDWLRFDRETMSQTNQARVESLWLNPRAENRSQPRLL